MAQIEEYRDPIASVVWAVGGTRGQILPNGEEDIEVLGPHWSVGFNNPMRIPAEVTVEIDGIRFVFGQGETSMRLEGATLDFVDGGFVVKERAI